MRLLPDTGRVRWAGALYSVEIRSSAVACSISCCMVHANHNRATPLSSLELDLAWGPESSSFYVLHPRREESRTFFTRAHACHRAPTHINYRHVTTPLSPASGAASLTVQSQSLTPRQPSRAA